MVTNAQSKQQKLESWNLYWGEWKWAVKKIRPSSEEKGGQSLNEKH